MPEVQQEQPALKAEQLIKIDPYFIRHSGLLSHQTVLKLGEYNLIVVPAHLSLEEARLLVVLTTSEVSLFSKFTENLNTITFHFEKLDEEVKRLHLKVNLISIVPYPDRKDICLITVKFKSKPREYEELIDSYLSQQKIRHEYFNAASGDQVTISPQTQSLLGYNGYCEALMPEAKRIALRALGVRTAEVASPQGWGSIQKGTPFTLKLYFKKYQFSLEATIQELPENPRAMVKAELSFSNELLEIMEDYRFRLTVLKKKATNLKS